MKAESTTPKAFESKWGFHGVNYEDFKILKTLYKWYWETLRDGYRWQAWNRKTVNQKGNGPVTNDNFISTATVTSFFTVTPGIKGGRTHYLDFTPILRPLMGRPNFMNQSIDYMDIVADFFYARMPVADAADVIAVNMAPYREFYKKVFLTE